MPAPSSREGATPSHGGSHDGGEAFVRYLTEARPRIESYLKAHAPRASEGAERADLDRFLYQPLARFTGSGGKRTRPALCLLGAELVGGSSDSALPVAAAIETFQSAALVHDDIADESELRRGEPCLHVAEGTGIAINVGDLALVDVFAQILRPEKPSRPATYDDATTLRLLRELLSMERRTLEGQALDLGWARDGRWDVSVEDYLYMARHKTAFYSAATPLATGAICGGGSDEQVEALRAFGMAAGLAFQLQDDLLNLVGDGAAQGKDFRSDITEGKRTLCVVWSLGHLDPPGRAELIRILESRTADECDLARAVGLMSEAGAIERVRSYARRLADEARGTLESVGLEAGPRAILFSMADFFVERKG